MAMLGCALGAAAQEEIPERQMNVRQGPETVFDRPPGEIFPALEGATATGENGRVGSELVFWGYEQRDGRRVFLFACAPSARLRLRDARARPFAPRRRPCSKHARRAATTVRRNCRNVAVAGPGDVRPGCDDRLENASLAVGLVSCG